MEKLQEAIKALDNIQIKGIDNIMNMSRAIAYIIEFMNDNSGRYIVEEGGDN